MRRISPPGRLLAAALIAFALAAATAAVVLRIGVGDREQAMVERAFGAGGSVSIAVAHALALLGDELVVFPLVAGVTVILVLRRHRWAVVWLLVSAVGGYATVQATKAVIGRARPHWETPLAEATTAAMPSGHAATGVDVWVLFGLLALALLSRRAGLPLALVCIAVGIAMGPSRLILGLHWPGDVLVGWLVGAGWLLLGLAVARADAQRATRPGRISRSGFVKPESS